VQVHILKIKTIGIFLLLARAKALAQAAELLVQGVETAKI